MIVRFKAPILLYSMMTLLLAAAIVAALATKPAPAVAPAVTTAAPTYSPDRLHTLPRVLSGGGGARAEVAEGPGETLRR